MSSDRKPTRPHVLVVDDNEDLCELMSRVVRLCGHDAVSATGGTAALAELARAVPSLVILDVMMPGMSGLDVLRAIRADHRLDRVPVVMCSAVSDPGVRERTVALGAQAYVLKGELSLDDVAGLITRYTSAAPHGHPSSGETTHA